MERAANLKQVGISESPTPELDLLVVKTSLDHGVEALAVARRESDRLARELSLLRSEAQLKFDEEHAELLNDLQSYRMALEFYEELVRERAVTLFAETGDKRPHPAVTVKEVKSLDYDPATALRWARSSGLALQLDKRQFSKLAEVAGLDWVRVQRQAVAYVATDLPVTNPEVNPLDILAQPEKEAGDLVKEEVS